MLKHLAGLPRNVFTTKLRDVIVPDTELTEPVPWVVLVLDLMTMDLRYILSHSDAVELVENHVITLMFNLLCAVEFLHSTNLMHRDIKPANFLVDENCRVKICDFGSTRPTPFKLNVK